MIGILAATVIQGSPARFAHGAVVSDSALASEVGAQVMRDGGNAVDAAVATGLALAVTFPAAGNLGGGGFMVIRRPDGSAFALDYRETAPAAASRNMYLDADGRLMGDSLSGPKASGIPGTVAGLYEAHRRFGKLKWSRLVQPAIDLARNGFVLDLRKADEFRTLATTRKRFAGTYATFGRGGNFYRAGERFTQPDLAKTLQRIRDRGRDGFYQGETAQFVVAEMKSGNGIITAQDLAGYQPKWREPLRGKWRENEIITMPPPSSGGAILLGMLGMLEKDDLQGFGSAKTVHLMTEAMRRAFADRAELFGDPDFVPVPIAKLLDPAYLATRRATIDPDHATRSSVVKPGVSPNEGTNTTHFSIVDADGTAVSNTYTLNMSHGSGVTVMGAGFLLNNEMDDFSAKPGSANGFGLIQGERNAIAPGRRPLSSMTPTIVTRNGKLRLVVGSPGGPTIINTVFEAILNVEVHRMDVQRAVSAPRFHHQWSPDELRAEAFALSPDTVAILRAMGHKVILYSSQGSCHAILVDSFGARLAGCDPRVWSAGSAGY